MSRFPLIQGAYEARGPLANAQSCINLYAERNPEDAPFPMTHYPAPGLDVYVDFTGYLAGPCRGLYAGSDGQLYAAVGQDVIWVRPDLSPPYIGMGIVPTTTTTPVIFCDNGQQLVAVDGTGWGGTGGLMNAGASPPWSNITDPAFYGSTRVDFIDTFLVFTQPNSNNFYTTTSNVVLPFNPLYYASKVGWNDHLVAAGCLHDNIWLLGAATTEIWFDAGGAGFPFARMPNSILQQGCVAPYTVVIADNAIYWLSQDRWGRAMCMRGEGYAARRVSTFAVENAWSLYGTITDAIGMAYQIGGHQVVGFLFPSANAWWGYDASTELWHQRMYADTSDAWLPMCTAFLGSVPGYGSPGPVLAGDRTNPRILVIDRSTYTDVGQPIMRQRAWPHTQTDGNRAVHTRFALNMNGNDLTDYGGDEVILDWSDDGGQNFGAQVYQTVNSQANGQYLWRRLGYTRDRVYRVTLYGAGEFAINGAWIDVIPEST